MSNCSSGASSAPWFLKLDMYIHWALQILSPLCLHLQFVKQMVTLSDPKLAL